MRDLPEASHYVKGEWPELASFAFCALLTQPIRVSADKKGDLPMKGSFVDFAKLKQAVSLISLLETYGVRLRNVGQMYLRGRCPLPTHGSKKSNDSFVVHRGKSFWVCHSVSCSSARKGKQGGDILDFVAAMQNCSIRDAALRL